MDKFTTKIRKKDYCGEAESIFLLIGEKQCYNKWIYQGKDEKE